jgi:hypothetical protein
MGFPYLPCGLPEFFSSSCCHCRKRLLAMRKSKTSRAESTLDKARMTPTLSNLGISHSGKAPDGPRAVPPAPCCETKYAFLGCAASAVLRVLDESIQTRYTICLDCDEAKPRLIRFLDANGAKGISEILDGIRVTESHHGFSFFQRPRTEEVVRKLRIEDTNGCQDFDHVCDYLHGKRNLAWAVSLFLQLSTSCPCVRVRVCACLLACLRSRVYVCARACMHACVCVRVRACMSTQI